MGVHRRAVDRRYRSAVSVLPVLRVVAENTVSLLEDIISATAPPTAEEATVA